MKGYPVSRVGDICKLVNGRAFKPEDWSTEGAPIIRIQNLNDNQKPFNYWSGPLDRQILVKPRDLLLAWSGTPGTSFGAHIWSGPPGILNQHIFRVDLDERCVSKEWWMRSRLPSY
jgi:type I restriction enzyme S subunit